MKRTFLLATLVALAGASTITPAQEETHTRARAVGSSSSSVQRSGDGNLQIASGTQLAAQLENTLDARKARVGDRVVLRTTETLKSNGQVLAKKGARLVGRVTDVQQRTKSNAESRIGLVFDRLESGSLTTPISATITSITQARAHVHSSNDDFPGAGSDVRSDSSARGGSGSSNSGGLLGGVTNTAGGVLDTTARATGDIVSGTTGAVGSAASGVGRTVGGIRISESAGATAEGGSTLSLTGNNLRLEKNTTFRLVLNQSASAGDNQ
ncbi:MAG TPA: hypothetical protein VD835_14565 [Pyrinomonadaceae bacterium]|nr:hypothetical protein [Pyrinomonadaceae bacterium]